jgi:hypothetical protein
MHWVPEGIYVLRDSQFRTPTNVHITDISLGFGYAGGDETRRGTLLRQTPLGAGRPQNPRHAGRPRRAQIRLRRHHPHASQAGRQGPAHRLHRGALDPHVLHDRGRRLEDAGQGRVGKNPGFKKKTKPSVFFWLFFLVFFLYLPRRESF